MAINIASHLLSSSLVSNTAEIASTLKDAITINSSETSPIITEFGGTEKRIIKTFVHDEHKRHVESTRFDRVLNKVLGEQAKSLKQIAQYLSPSEQRKQSDYLASKLGNFGAGTVNSPISAIPDMLSLLPDLLGGSDSTKTKGGPASKGKWGKFKRITKFLGKTAGKVAGGLGLAGLFSQGEAPAYTPDIASQNTGGTTTEEESAKRNSATADEEAKAKSKSKVSQSDADFKEASPKPNNTETVRETTTHSITNNNNTSSTHATETNNNLVERERINTVNERLSTNVPEVKSSSSPLSALGEAADDIKPKGGLFSSLSKGFGKALGGIVTVAAAIPDVLDTVSVFNDDKATTQDKAESAGGTAGKIVGGVAGGSLGGTIGSTIGAGVGMLFGGVGAIPLSIAGGFIGSAVGSWLGSEGGEEVGKDIGSAVAKVIPDETKKNDEENAAIATPAPEILPDAVTKQQDSNAVDINAITPITGKQVGADTVQLQPPVPAVSAESIILPPLPLPPAPMGMVNNIQPLRTNTSSPSSSSSSSSTAINSNTNDTTTAMTVTNVKGETVALPSAAIVTNALSSMEQPVAATAQSVPSPSPVQTSFESGVGAEGDINSQSSSMSNIIDKSVSVFKGLASLPMVSTVVDFISKYNPMTLGKQLGTDTAATPAASSSSTSYTNTDLNNQYQSVMESVLNTITKTSPLAAVGSLVAGPAVNLFGEGQTAPIINTVSNVLSSISNLGSSSAAKLFGLGSDSNSSSDINNLTNSNTNNEFKFNKSSPSFNSKYSAKSNSSSLTSISSILGLDDGEFVRSASAYAPPVSSAEFNRENYVEPASSTDMVQLDKTMKETFIVKEQQAASSPNVSMTQRDVSINLNNTPMVTNDLGLLIINSGVV